MADDRLLHAINRLRHLLEGSPEHASDVIRREGAGAPPVPGALRFVPEGSAPADEATVVYRGDLAAAGGEITLGDDVFVQFETYAAGGYIGVGCPTVFSVTDDVDRAMLVRDAAHAERTGEFPAHVLHPLATILGQDDWIRGSTASVDDGAPPTPPSDVVDVGASVARQREAFSRDEAALVGGYIAAATVLRAATGRFTEPIRVRGFGGAASAARRRPGDRSLVVLDVGERSYVADAVTGGLCAVPAAIADVVGTSVRGDVDDALLSRAGASDVDTVLAAVRAALGGTARVSAEEPSHD
ncbi:hypothetical protein MN032_08240 [Agromyces atrinae]|uniref:hypothetical protein n=1 Tax=Agromyces atrinae TaxID=592376 RepID=UPI001F587A0C|nr:hypothetical protein [Agromyces atrinae]MCI2957679.1 hypothetical protein [Agromyces atrinae]